MFCDQLAIIFSGNRTPLFEQDDNKMFNSLLLHNA